MIYSKAVFQPPGKNTLFVTFSGTGDTHGGSKLAMSCTIDGILCGGLGAPASIGACGATPGWLCLLNMPAGGAIANCSNGGGGPGDCHDNNINQTWCLTAAVGAHVVVLRMASIPNPATGAADVAFIEGGKYYIDSTNFTDGNPDNCSKNPGTGL